MKRIPRLVLGLLALALAVGLSSSAVRADSPYTTWTPGPGGGLFITQDAYTPLAEIDLPVAGPEDLVHAPDGLLYLADTGNGRIVKLNHQFEVIAEFGAGVLQRPTGVFVDEEGTLYVADAARNTVVIFDQDGRLLREFGRPVEPLFGKNREFLPRKIAVDARRNLYVISEGSVDGIVQLNANGNFIGYFGANASAMSLKMILQRMFLTREQLDQFIKNEAASPSNIAIDQRSLIYTITAGTAPWQSIRKFTIAGKNVFPGTFGSQSFRDLQVSSAEGLLLTVDAEGAILEYDLDGTLLFAFLATDTGDQRLGTLRSPTAIEREGDLIYVLDKDKNALVVYRRTAFARRVHEGVRRYMEGFYEEARPLFEEVLKYNGSFLLSYQAIADAHFKAGDYAGALSAYRYAEDQSGYSQAFWELRNQVLQRYLSEAITWGFGLWLALAVFTRVERRRHWLDPLRGGWRALRRIRLVDDFLLMFKFIRHPSDSFYYIKAGRRGSLLFAGLLYGWVVVVRVLSLYVTGFSFNPYTVVARIPVENEVLVTVVALALWNTANYLVANVTDGEGRVRDVVIGSAYGLVPYALFALPIAVISNVLTLNEIFIYSFALQIMWFWVGLLYFIMVMEIHNYSFTETVRNVLITLFTMALFLLTAYIIFVLFTQLFDFISAVALEVGLRG
jgi:DNA-binding beta-propeller fold protein YncE